MSQAQQIASSRQIELEGVQVVLIRNVNVPVREPGIIEKLPYREGAFVKQGDVIAHLDEKTYELAENISQLEKRIADERAKSDVNRRFAMKSMEVSAAVMKRGEQANERFPKSISKTEMDKSRLEAERDVLALEQAENELRIAELESVLENSKLELNQLKREYRTISAPFDGLIVEMFAQEGEWLNAGEPVLRIIDVEKMRIDTVVDAQLYGPELLNQTVTFTVDTHRGTETFEGVVNFVSPEIEPINQTISVRAEVINRENLLRPGASGKLVIQLPQ
jgi:macrolide-specific efflux system membrane fusion protein